MSNQNDRQNPAVQDTPTARGRTHYTYQLGVIQPSGPAKPIMSGDGQAIEWATSEDAIQFGKLSRQHKILNLKGNEKLCLLPQAKKAKQKALKEF